MPKCDFNNFAKATLLKSHFGMVCSPVDLLHIFRTSFLKNTSGGLLLFFAEHHRSTDSESGSELVVHTQLKL